MQCEAATAGVPPSPTGKSENRRERSSVGRQKCYYGVGRGPSRVWSKQQKQPGGHRAFNGGLLGLVQTEGNIRVGLKRLDR